jgi:hypothetical protein
VLHGAAKAGVRNSWATPTVLREKGIRATTIMPAEVDTDLDNRPRPTPGRAPP